MDNPPVNNDVFNIEQMTGRHIFGRPLLRRYANGLATDTVYDVSFVNDQWNGVVLTQLEEELHDMWRSVIDRVIQHGARPRDLVRIHIGHSDLEHGDIKIPLQRLNDLTPNAIMERIAKVMQSHKQLMIDGITQISVGVIKFPEARGRLQMTCCSDLAKKKSIISITNNDDDMCLPRAIVMAQTWEKYQNKVINRWSWQNLCDSKKPHQKERALKMIEDSGITEYTSLDAISQFEKHLKANIVVVSARHQNKVIRPQKLNPDFTTIYYLYYVSAETGPGHFHTIKSVTGAINMDYFCQGCLSGYSHKGEHHCSATCVKCKTSVCIEEQHSGNGLSCRTCGVDFVSQACFDRHQQHATYGGECIAKSTCERFWQCTECRQYFETRNRTKKDHRCNEFFCRICVKWDNVKTHRCYMKRPDNRQPKQKFIFFDFECNQETGEHIPNLVVARKYDLKTGREQEIVFRGDDVTTNFCEWLFVKENKGSTVIAHNMKSYDGYFLMRYLIKNAIKHTILFTGSKIMTMKVENGLNIQIIDSLNFFPMKLSKLPATFGLEGVRKGDFPHLFNVSANYGYVGPYPDISYYGLDQRNTSERQQLMEWHATVKDTTFDFEKELLEYCRTDVRILAEACLKFRTLLLQIGNVDPFNYISIASTCMAVFKTNFLEEEYEVITVEESRRAEVELREPIPKPVIVRGLYLFAE